MGAVLEGFFLIGHLISQFCEDFIQEIQTFVFLMYAGHTVLLRVPAPPEVIYSLGVKGRVSGDQEGIFRAFLRSFIKGHGVDFIVLGINTNA